MLYLGIDQHARQITISLRDENGDVLQARQVSTQPAKINEFFQRLTRERLQGDEQFVAVLEVCGFNDWLIRMLGDYRCAKVILIQPDERKKRKTDRRDAAALSELLWVNRARLLQGKPVRGLRQVDIASTTDQEFDQPVTVHSITSLQLFNHTTGFPVDIAAATVQNNGTTAVMWDLSAVSLPDGIYSATLLNTEAGLVGTHSFLFHVLAGDSNGDAQVGFPDLFDLQNNFNVSGVIMGPGDLDGDGTVGFGDVFVLQNTFNNSLAVPAMDFGDAPESGTSLPTTLANNGARHVLGSDLRLGATVDGEADGQPDADAAGDDNVGDDEDGVTFSALQAGATAGFFVTASAPGMAVLNAWFDFNADGDWDDAGEQVFFNRELTDGVNVLSTTIPSGATVGSTFARFRVTSTAGYSYFGMAPAEVEDYQVTVLAALGSSLRVAPTELLDRRAAAFADLITWPTLRIKMERHVEKPIGGNVLPTAPKVIDRAIAEVASTARRPKELAESLPSLDEHLVDQWYAEESGLLLRDNVSGNGI